MIKTTIWKKRHYQKVALAFTILVISLANLPSQAQADYDALPPLGSPSGRSSAGTR